MAKSWEKGYAMSCGGNVHEFQSQRDILYDLRLLVWHLTVFALRLGATKSGPMVSSSLPSKSEPFLGTVFNERVLHIIRHCIKLKCFLIRRARLSRTFCLSNASWGPCTAAA